MTTISVPTTLTNFSHSRPSSSRISDTVLSPVVGSKGRLAVAAVHGDGVWTYDVKSIRPTSSFTVPPSTLFASVPVSFYTTKKQSLNVDENGEKNNGATSSTILEVDDQNRERITVIAIESGEGMKQNDKAKVLWLWRGEDENSKKSIIQLANPCHSIHVFSDDRLAVISSNGSISILNHDFTMIQEAASSSNNRSKSVVIAAKVLTDSSVALGSPGRLFRVVLVEEMGTISLVAVDIDGEGDARMKEVNEGLIAVGSGSKLGQASISDDGSIVAIDSDNKMFYRHINDISSTDSPLHLVKPTSTILSLPSPSSSSSSPPTFPLCIFTTPGPGASLLLAVPSSSFPAILSTIPVSSTITSGTVSSISLLSRSRNVYTIGVALHISSSSSTGSSRSVVYITEISVPLSGIGLNILLGSKEKSMVYLATSNEKTSESSSGFNESTSKMIQQLRTALYEEKNGKSAENIWMTWLANEEAKSASFSHGRRLAKISTSLVKAVLEVIFSATLGAQTSVEAGKEEEWKEKINKNGVISGVYPKKIMKTLVDRKLLDDSMWEGGLIMAGLLPCGDMRSISQLIRNSPSLPSSTTVSLLNSALSSTEGTSLNLNAVLSDILSAPLPDSKYRVELARQLSVDGALKVLEHLVELAEDIVETGDGLENWPEMENAALSASSLRNIITHCSFILDAHSTNLLDNPGSPMILERLQTLVTQLLSFQTDYRRLRAPIDAALTLASREQHRLNEAAAKRAAAAVARGGSGHGHGSKKAVKGKEGGEGGEEVLGTVEDVIGRWKVEDIVF